MQWWVRHPKTMAKKLLLLCEADVWPGVKGQRGKTTERAKAQIIIPNQDFES